MKSTEILFLDTVYNRCKILGDVCSGGDCRICSIPIIMPAKAREIIEEMN